MITLDFGKVEEKYNMDVNKPLLEHAHHRLSELTKNNASVNKTFLEFNKCLLDCGYDIFTIAMLMEIDKCITFAATKHQHQKRKDAAETPYIVHPIGVALILLKEANIHHAEILKIALLHDTLEDTDTTSLEISNNFGYFVADAVKELSDEVGDIPGQKTQDQATRKRLEIEHAGEMTYAATIVKLADKLYNLRDLIDNPPDKWSNERFLGYADFVEQIVSNIKKNHQDKLTNELIKLEDLVMSQIQIVRLKYRLLPL